MSAAARFCRRFRRNTSGVSAVEFAVLTPVMLLLLLGSFDIARAVDVKNKTSLLSRTVSDFVSQSTTVSRTELDNIIAASKAVLYPYSDARDLLQVEIQSIRQKPDQSGYFTDWSYKTRANGVPEVTSTDRPNPPIIPPEPSVIYAKVNYTYRLKFSGFLASRLGLGEISMGSATYMSPRWGTPIEPSGF